MPLSAFSGPSIEIKRESTPCFANAPVGPCSPGSPSIFLSGQKPGGVRIRPWLAGAKLALLSRSGAASGTTNNQCRIFLGFHNHMMQKSAEVSCSIVIGLFSPPLRTNVRSYQYGAFFSSAKRGLSAWPASDFPLVPRTQRTPWRFGSLLRFAVLGRLHIENEVNRCQQEVRPVRFDHERVDGLEGMGG